MVMQQNLSRAAQIGAVSPRDVPPAAVQSGITPEQWRKLRELATRIMGYPLDQAAPNLLAYELGRARITETDYILPRPLVVSDVLTGLTAGNHNLTWTFRTLGVVTGVTAVLYPGLTGVTGVELSMAVRKGSDGGYVIGTDQDPAAWCSFGTVFPNYDTVRPMAIQPCSVKSTNQWTGTLFIDPAVGQNEVDVAINWHGVGLWSPDGQIAT